jgi:hypothetical protein
MPLTEIRISTQTDVIKYLIFMDIIFKFVFKVPNDYGIDHLCRVKFGGGDTVSPKTGGYPPNDLGVFMFGIASGALFRGSKNKKCI